MSIKQSLYERPVFGHTATSCNVSGSLVNGVSSYNHLSDKPSINGVELIGDMTLEELGLDIEGLDLGDLAQLDFVSEENLDEALKEKINTVNEEEVVSTSSFDEFPEQGDVDTIYKSYVDKQLYQWNSETNTYEPLNQGSIENIVVIDGGNANGTN